MRTLPAVGQVLEAMPEFAPDAAMSPTLARELRTLQARVWRTSLDRYQQRSQRRLLALERYARLSALALLQITPALTHEMVLYRVQQLVHGKRFAGVRMATTAPYLRISEGVRRALAEHARRT